MDSGCSFHMTSNKSWFQNLAERDSGSVLLGNDLACRIRGIGLVGFRMRDGLELVLQNVRYVPDLKKNLISLGELDSQGFNFRGGN